MYLINCTHIEQHCLSKQRVKEAIEKWFLDDNSGNNYEHFKKELGLQ